jgi:hypothetical protein
MDKARNSTVSPEQTTSETTSSRGALENGEMGVETISSKAYLALARRHSEKFCPASA